VEIRVKYMLKLKHRLNELFRSILANRSSRLRGIATAIIL